MGSIDCDPASCEVANKTIKAAQIFTEKDEGLPKEWRGNVWMNPPYAQPLIFEFAEALGAKFDSGEVSQACVLVNNATETEWFSNLAAHASATCFLRGRTKFLNERGEEGGAPLQGQAVLYLGPKVNEFAAEFREFGRVLVPHEVFSSVGRCR